MAYDFSNLTVYIVDANAFSRQLMVGLTGALGIPRSAVKEWADAEAALEEMEHYTPDLILCDINLPGMSGVDFIRAVRQLEDEVKRYIPIIVCTAYTEKARVIKYRDAGAHEVLHKPMSVRTLYQRLVSVIESPRSFIYSPVFHGPDRRRKTIPQPGDERRTSKAPEPQEE